MTDIGIESLTLIETYGEACKELGWVSNEITMSQGQIQIAYKRMKEAKQNLLDYLKTYNTDL